MLRNVAVAAGNSRDEEGREKGLKLSTVATGGGKNREGGRERGREEEEEAEEEELVKVLRDVLEGEKDGMVREHLEWAIGRLEVGREEGGGVVGIQPHQHQQNEGWVRRSQGMTKECIYGEWT